MTASVATSTPPAGILAITKASDGTAALQVSDDRVTIGLQLTAAECTQLADAFSAAPPAASTPPAETPQAEAAAIMADPAVQTAIAEAIAAALAQKTTPASTAAASAAPAATG